MQQVTVEGSTDSFETALKEIEKIILDLEKGDRPLDTQLKAFEQGIALSRNCLKQLEALEKKVEMLVSEGDGAIKSTHFETPPTSV